jgi:hypothetical protein
MRIVINHLTRMDPPRICVAGINPDTGQHVRPITGHSNPLTRAILAETGGSFALGALVELGEITPDPTPPEIEDHLFWPAQAKVIGQLSNKRYLELMHQHARSSLEAIFGHELVRHDWNYAVEQGHGRASLGILRARRRSDIEIDRYGKLRVRLNDADKPAFLPVTDVRFVEADHTTIKADVVLDTSTRMRKGVEVLLMLGLARAFRRSDDDSERHWLQVNGICMADRPLGDRP